jgi:hypothetical protein
VSDGEGSGSALTEGLGHAARQAAEVAAVLSMAAQAALRMRERQLHAQADHTTRDRGQLRVDYAAARLAWSPAFDAAFASAGPLEVAQVWGAAQPWAAHDPAAADATRRAELRLEELAPEVMARYRDFLDAGTEPAQAMHTAASALGGAAAARAQASEERAAALAAGATPDLPSTRLDEHHQGVAEGAGHTEVADASGASPPAHRRRRPVPQSRPAARPTGGRPGEQARPGRRRGLRPAPHPAPGVHGHGRPAAGPGAQPGRGGRHPT